MCTEKEALQRHNCVVYVVAHAVVEVVFLSSFLSLHCIPLYERAIWLRVEHYSISLLYHNGNEKNEEKKQQQQQLRSRRMNDITAYVIIVITNDQNTCTKSHKYMLIAHCFCLVRARISRI